MKFKIRFADQIVGIFVLVAIVCVAVILISIAVNQRWFAKNYHFTSLFPSGDGLTSGMPITLKGFEIGRISGISLDAQNQVDVRFYIQDRYYDKVKPNSVLELTSSSIGLGVSLKFHPGSNQFPPQPEGAFIPALDSDEGRRLVDENLVEIPTGGDVIGSVIAKINPLLDEARLTIGEIKRVATSVDDAIGGRSGPLGTMANNLALTPGKVNRAVDDMSSKIGTLLDKIAIISDNLADISVKTRGIIGDLSTNLDEISQNLKEMTAGLKNTQGLAKRLLDPKGSIDTFMNDSNELYNQVDTALKNANQIISELHGLIAESRPQVSSILEKGGTTLDTATDVLQAAKNNPLLKGGVPPRPQQTSPLNSYRDENF